MELSSINGLTYPLKFRNRERLDTETTRSIGEDAAAWYRDGAPVRAIARHIGRSYGFTHRLLFEIMQLEPRRRGKAVAPGPGNASSEAPPA